MKQVVIKDGIAYVILKKILQLRSGVLTIKVFQFVFAIKESLLKIN